MAEIDVKVVDGAFAEESPSRRGDRRMIRAAQAALDGRAAGLARILPFLGPAFIASIAYIDPGNFATNIQGGAQFGYSLLWVITAANLMAAFLQALSAKLGVATDSNLPLLCRLHLPHPLNFGLWIISEIAAMATDLAEFIGAALGFNLLFHLPLFWAGLLTGVATFAILGLQRYGFRPLEAVIASFVGVIALAYVLETILARPDIGQIARHAVTPALPSGSLFLAIGILGATVMPHVLYLHSALMQRRVPVRTEGERRRIARLAVVDVAIAMTLAGVINGAMMFMAASVFCGSGAIQVNDLGQAYHTLTPLLGGAASVIFGISLLASGLSSSTVGTMAGQVIMQGFVGWTIPQWLRRLITMTPALAIIGLGIDPTQTIIFTQVLLSFALIAPIGALLYFTGRRDIMGSLVNQRAVAIIGYVIGALIIALNLWLIVKSI